AFYSRSTYHLPSAFLFQAEDGIRDFHVTGVQTCALPICFIMTKNNEKQAYIPSGAIPVENPNGTAPSFIVEDPRGVIIALPGVRSEERRVGKARTTRRRRCQQKR